MRLGMVVTNEKIKFLYFFFIKKTWQIIKTLLHSKEWEGGLPTNNFKFYKHLKLLRNHGLSNRDTVKICGYNSRLDTFQAVVGNWLLPKAKQIANKE